MKSSVRSANSSKIKYAALNSKLLHPSWALLRNLTVVRAFGGGVFEPCLSKRVG